MTVYYNDNDPFCVEWLKLLVRHKHIPFGEVDGRPIQEVRPGDVRGFKQCHFFAGIGGWANALHLAGWPEDKPVWTGSCPCQPFSAAGKRRGNADERHLWPEFQRLIAECEPSVVFGEQVASKDGRVWLAGVRADLEALGYAVGAADLCAAGVGAPHIRQRLFWVADAESIGCRQERPITGGCSEGDSAEGSAERSRTGYWSTAEWLLCLDGKARRIEPRFFPLAHGISNRVGRLRGYGNAIVPQVAAEFITSFMEITNV